MDLELTKELKEKLNGFMAITPDNTFKFTPEFYRKNNVPKKFIPIFTLKILNGIELSEIENHSGYTVVDVRDYNKREFHGMTGTKRIEILKKGIVGWKNLINADGKIIDYVDENSIKFLPLPIQNDLMNAIVDQTSLSEEELRALE
jgi:hypothetical protein